MRKISIFILMFLSLVLIASCGKKADVQIIDSTIEGNTYIYEFDVLNEELSLETIAYGTANEIYLVLKDEISTKAIFLELTFYVSKEKKLTLKYQVNKNHQSLGLTLLEKINH